MDGVRLESVFVSRSEVFKEGVLREKAGFVCPVRSLGSA